MKRLRLSPFTRQLIIFLLLVALLWESRPLLGLDGRMLVEFREFIDFGNGDRTAKGYINEGDYIEIDETKYDEHTRRAKYEYILSAIPIASAIEKEPNKAFLFISQYVPLWRIVPRRLQLYSGGWILVLRLTPEEYDILQGARRRGNRMDIVKMRKHEAEAYLKWKKLPYSEQQRFLVRLMLQSAL